MIIKIGNYIDSKFMYRGQVFSKKGDCICLCSGMAGGVMSYQPSAGYSVKRMGNA